MDRKRTRVIWEVEASKKIGLWRQKVNKTKILVHPQHLGDAAQKCTRASQ